MTGVPVSRELLRKALEAFPRCPLSHLPTPLEPLERLSARCGVNLFIKRDDQTGLAFGGNKSRKLDFLMADVLAQRADSVITWAGVQSNWCRQLAAASCKLGVHPILLLFTRPRLPRALDGNFLLDLICGAEIHLLELESSRKLMSLDGVQDLVGSLVEKESRAGRKAYVAPIGASLIEGSMRKPLGAVAYVNGFLEILEQMEARKSQIDAVVFATGSGSTHAGLFVGAQLLSPHTKIVGISVSDSRDDMLHCVRSIAQETWRVFAGTARAGDCHEDDLVVFDQYLQEGYGIPNQSTIETIRLVAGEEGILLDPVYTGRALNGLLDLVKKGYFKPGQNVVFLHTGGMPAIFAYREEFQKYLAHEGTRNNPTRTLV
ncbi:MAG: D-cysteine desulfhydrase family protein [Candidatus Acidiferrales bacterium]